MTSRPAPRAFGAFLKARRAQLDPGEYVLPTGLLAAVRAAADADNEIRPPGNGTTA